MQLRQRAPDKQTDNIVAECLSGLKAKYRHGGTVRIQSAAYSEGVLCSQMGVLPYNLALDLEDSSIICSKPSSLKR